MMQPNIIMILLDGARCDRLETSSEFNEIKKSGFLMKNVSTTIPYTIGSLNCLFTGLYGKENGIDAYYKVLGLKESITTLFEILQSNEYFTCCDLLHKKIFSNRGFDIHQAHDEYNDNLFIHHPNFLQQCFLKAKNKPLFCFLHYTEIHKVTVSEILKKYEWDDDDFYDNKNNNLKNYDKTFSNSVKYVKTIINKLAELNKFENSIIIIFSDHGTGVGERFGERNYGSFTYDETIKTFFLFLGPKIKPNISSENLLSNIDVFPTILELLNLKIPKNLPGKSFAKNLIDEKSTPITRKYTFSETGALHGPFPSPEKPNVFCIKSKEFKLIYLQTPEQWKLYNLQNDPNELTNIYGTGISVESEMKYELLKWINRT